jgi:predicted 3-demethylubiquinone-9 3-methyltransferase (glyoxalase superfamily)
VNFYVSVFKNSEIETVVRYVDATAKASGMPVGSVMTMAFHIEGQKYVALNGEHYFKFTEAISFVVNCESQDEVDYYWAKLTEGGDKNAQRCGWLNDKYGVSWQIVPTILPKRLQGDPHKSKKVMEALLQMSQLDIRTLQQAYDQS